MWYLFRWITYQEQKDPFYDVLTRIIKDIASWIQLVNAITEGEKAEVPSREQVFKILESDLWKLNLETALREMTPKQNWLGVC